MTTMSTSNGWPPQAVRGPVSIPTSGSVPMTQASGNSKPFGK